MVLGKGINMDINEIIKKKFDIRVINSPPILCWMGSGNHRLADNNKGRLLLAELYAELGYTVGVEVGVDRGFNAENILSKNSELKLICVDSWASDRAEEHHQDALKRLEKYNVIFMKMTSWDASLQIEDNSIDFVYIDSKRDFNSVVLDIIEWGRKVKKGGIISGRGYCNFFESGVVKAVNAYTYAHNIRNWYVTREIEPQYFWEK